MCCGRYRCPISANASFCFEIQMILNQSNIVYLFRPKNFASLNSGPSILLINICFKKKDAKTKSSFSGKQGYNFYRPHKKPLRTWRIVILSYRQSIAFTMRRSNFIRKMNHFNVNNANDSYRNQRYVFIRGVRYEKYFWGEMKGLIL